MTESRVKEVIKSYFSLNKLIDKLNDIGIQIDCMDDVIMSFEHVIHDYFEEVYGYEYSVTDLLDIYEGKSKFKTVDNYIKEIGALNNEL